MGLWFKRAFEGNSMGYFDDCQWVDDDTVAALKARLAKAVASGGGIPPTSLPTNGFPDGSRSNAASMRNGSLNGGHRALSRSPTTSRARPRRNPRASAARASRRSPERSSKPARRVSNVRGATLAADGSVSLQFGEAEPSEASNPWDAEIERLTKQ